MSEPISTLTHLHICFKSQYLYALDILYTPRHMMHDMTKKEILVVHGGLHIIKRAVGCMPQSPGISRLETHFLHLFSKGNLEAH